MKKPKKLSDLQRLTLDHGRVYWEVNNTHSLQRWLYYNGYPDEAKLLEGFKQLALRESRARYERERERILESRAIIKETVGD